jgi:phage-related protein
MWGAIKTAVQVWWLFFKSWLVDLKAAWKVAWDALKNSVKAAWDLISGVITFNLHLIENTIGLILDIITGKWSKVWGDLKKLVGQAIGDAVSVLKNATKDFGSLLYDAGKDIIRGLIGGIKSMAGAAKKAAEDVASGAKNGVKSLLHINSPSKVFAEIGKSIPEGMALGIIQHAGHTYRAVSQLAQGAMSLASASLGSVGGDVMATVAEGTVGVLPNSVGRVTPIGPSTEGVSVVHNHVTVNVAGSVRSDRDLRDMFQQEMLRLNGRNTSNGLTFKR